MTQIIFRGEIVFLQCLWIIFRVFFFYRGSIVARQHPENQKYHFLSSTEHHPGQILQLATMSLRSVGWGT